MKRFRPVEAGVILKRSRRGHFDDSFDPLFFTLPTCYRKSLLLSTRVSLNSSGRAVELIIACWIIRSFEHLILSSLFLASCQYWIFWALTNVMPQKLQFTCMLSLISQMLTSLVTFVPLLHYELLPNKGFVVEPGESILWYVREIVSLRKSTLGKFLTQFCSFSFSSEDMSRCKRCSTACILEKK